MCLHTHYFKMHLEAFQAASTKSPLLKHDLPIHGLMPYTQVFMVLRVASKLLRHPSLVNLCSLYLYLSLYLSLSLSLSLFCRVLLFECGADGPSDARPLSSEDGWPAQKLSGDPNSGSLSIFS